MIDKFADQAYKSIIEEDDNETKIERVRNFQIDYKSEIERLMERYVNKFIELDGEQITIYRKIFTQTKKRIVTLNHAFIWNCIVLSIS